ncbi:MAG: ribosomal-processing cysteine protease Prp, partial [Oscillospiraceae bacterium]|nr:ribosomal-processing cysteine protease Prp [Oscillospiraceae bacterium]
MTTITFRMEGDRIVGFDSQGHSGYAEAGEDIVCAAITSAIRLVEATINDV